MLGTPPFCFCSHDRNVSPRQPRSCVGVVFVAARLSLPLSLFARVVAFARALSISCVLCCSVGGRGCARRHSREDFHSFGSGGVELGGLPCSCSGRGTFCRVVGPTLRLRFVISRASIKSVAENPCEYSKIRLCRSYTKQNMPRAVASYFTLYAHTLD